MKEKVEALVNQALQKNKDLFLIDMSISPTNQIRVIIDGDKGVSVQDCIDFSREIEHNLDREEEDFSLEVLSAGVSEPLQQVRQYKKNVGRTLKVKTTEGETVEGDLVEATEDQIKLTWKTREPKPVGKGKHTVKKEANIAYDTIDEATVLIKF